MPSARLPWLVECNSPHDTKLSSLERTGEAVYSAAHKSPSFMLYATLVQANFCGRRATRNVKRKSNSRLDPREKKSRLTRSLLGNEKLENLCKSKQARNVVNEPNEANDQQAATDCRLLERYQMSQLARRSVVISMTRT